VKRRKRKRSNGQALLKRDLFTCGDAEFISYMFHFLDCSVSYFGIVNRDFVVNILYDRDSFFVFSG